METIDTIFKRYSCRDFQSTKLPHDILDTILHAGLQAPSSMNRQQCIITALTNQSLLEELKTAICVALQKEAGYSCFYNAPTVIIVSAPKDYLAVMCDGSCILENIFLAATAKEVASCWVNQLHGVEDTPAIRDILIRCNIPANHTICGCAILGYPKAPGKPKEKFSNRIQYVE